MTGFNASDISKLNLTDADAVSAIGRQTWTSAQVRRPLSFMLVSR